MYYYQTATNNNYTTYMAHMGKNNKSNERRKKIKTIHELFFFSVLFVAHKRTKKGEGEKKRIKKRP